MINQVKKTKTKTKTLTQETLLKIISRKTESKKQEPAKTFAMNFSFMI